MSYPPFPLDIFSNRRTDNNSEWAYNLEMFVSEVCVKFRKNSCREVLIILYAMTWISGACAACYKLGYYVDIHLEGLRETSVGIVDRCTGIQPGTFRIRVKLFCFTYSFV